MKIETGEEIEKNQGEAALVISCALVILAKRAGGTITISREELEANKYLVLRLNYNRNRGNIEVSALGAEEAMFDMLKSLKDDDGSERTGSSDSNGAMA
jgi:hypothetical protein